MKLRYLLLVLTLMLCFTGCQEELPQDPTYPEPTLPSFDESIAPKNHLQTAMDALKGKEYSASWGYGMEQPLKLTSTDNMDDLRKLVPNPDFLSQFNNMRMMIVPSNTGTFSYQVLELTPEALCQLLCGRDLTVEEQQTLAAYPDAMGTVALDVDENGVFCGLRVELPLSEATWILKIQITLK